MGGADRCGCVTCRNFAAQRDRVYPASFSALLRQMGIDPSREGEVFNMVGPFEDRVRLTGGWFYFIGELVQKRERLMEAEGFQYWFQPSFPRPPAGFGEPVAAIEFSTRLPWILEEPPA